MRCWRVRETLSKPARDTAGRFVPSSDACRRQLLVRADADVLDKIAAAAARGRVSIAEQVRMILDWWLEEHGLDGD